VRSSRRQLSFVYDSTNTSKSAGGHKPKVTWLRDMILGGKEHTTLKVTCSLVNDRTSLQQAGLCLEVVLVLVVTSQP
jgi:hypothetical protein